MASIWDSIVGQSRAIDRLRHSARHPVHAYLLVGPDGCGKDEAARAFAAELLSHTDDPQDRINTLTMRGAYVDVHEIRREGASILKEQAEEIIRLASTTGAESRNKVIIVHEVHTMQDTAAARLLKTVEEPADGIVIVMLADQFVPSLTTIASRCVQVQFAVLDDSTIAHQLIADGSDALHAEQAARLAHGNMERARLLSTDTQLVHRYERFANVPRRIDGTGSTVAAIVDELLGLIDEAAAPLAARHAREVAEMDAQLAATGARKGGKRALEDRHKRELRRHRTDELRSGLSAIASVYRDELVSNSSIHRPQVYIDAVALLHDAISRLGLNVNEALLLRDVIWKLPSLNTDAALHFAH